jgi:hypothetical protein
MVEAFLSLLQISHQNKYDGKAVTSISTFRIITLQYKLKVLNTSLKID